MGGGALQTTGNPLDVAIQGDGFFQVGNGAPARTAPFTATCPAPSTTRAPATSTLNSAGFLTTQSGQYVVGSTAPSSSSSATPTLHQVPPGSTNVAIGQDGGVSYTDENSTSPTFGQTVTAGYMTLATFPNAGRPAARRRLDRGAPPASSGAADRRHPERGGFGRRSPASWRCPTSTSPPSSPT